MKSELKILNLLDRLGTRAIEQDIACYADTSRLVIPECIIQGVPKWTDSLEPKYPQTKLRRNCFLVSMVRKRFLSGLQDRKTYRHFLYATLGELAIVRAKFLVLNYPNVIHVPHKYQRCDISMHGEKRGTQ